LLISKLEAAEGGLCLLEASEVLEALEAQEMLEAREMLEVREMPMMRCVLLCMLEAVESRLCLLEVLTVLDVLEVLEVLEVLKVMRCCCFVSAPRPTLCVIRVPPTNIGAMAPIKCGWQLRVCRSR